MKRYLSDNKLKIIFSLSSLILMWLTWIIAFAVVKNDLVIPSFWQTVNKVFALFGEGYFWLAFLNTLKRVAIAFAISFITGLICSAIGVLIKNFNVFLSPLITVLRTVPTMAIILILLIWTSPKIAPVIITVLVLFPMIYAQINAAIGQIDSGILQVAKVYDFSKKTKLTKIYLPMVFPYVFSQTGANLSFAIKLIISAEVMANTYVSIGGLMMETNAYIQIENLAALTLIAVIAGVIIELIFYFINRLCFKWNRVEVKND